KPIFSIYNHVIPSGFCCETNLFNLQSCHPFGILLQNQSFQSIIMSSLRDSVAKPIFSIYNNVIPSGFGNQSTFYLIGVFANPEGVI
ncbi:MAG: hypothetical protein WCP32_16670, partial [Bacteroidota bacterium]